MPRRGAAALVATVFAVALLISFKTPDQPNVALGAPPTAVGGDPAPTPRAIAGGARPTPQPLVSALLATLPPPGAATPAPTAAGLTGGTRQITGQDIGTPYGDVQVQVTLQSGKMVDIQALRLPNDRRLSAQISAYVGPILHDEALQAQSASIDTISGASYTSEGYRESLQSALDQANN